MENDALAVLENLLAATVIQRGLTLRDEWATEAFKRMGREPTREEIPEGAVFIDQAVAEVRRHRERVIAGLAR